MGHEGVGEGSKGVFDSGWYFGVDVARDEARGFEIFEGLGEHFGEMSGMARPMALKRVAWFSESTQSISIDHLPVKRERTLRTGQVSMRVYFLDFLVGVMRSYSKLLT